MKRKLIIAGIIMLMFVSYASAEDTLIGTIEYKESEMFVLDGNITLFDSLEEVSLLFRLYDSSSNKTIYNIKSEEIEYDYSFVNDTKSYILEDQLNDTYIILVDYSSIEVPPSLDDIRAGYESTIEELNQTIVELREELNELRIAYNESFNEMENLTYLYEIEKSKNQPLLDKIANLSAEISSYEQMEISAMETINYWKSKTNEYKDNWAMFTSDEIYINFASVVLGIIISFLIFYIFWCKYNNRPVQGYEQIKNMVFKQKPFPKNREPEGSPLDDKFLKGGKKDDDRQS